MTHLRLTRTWALSQVVTILIILVVSDLMASGTLTSTQGLNLIGPFNQTIGGEALNFTQTSENLLLSLEESLIIYIDQPDSITRSNVHIDLRRWKNE